MVTRLYIHISSTVSAYVMARHLLRCHNHFYILLVFWLSLIPTHTHEYPIHWHDRLEFHSLLLPAWCSSTSWWAFLFVWSSAQLHIIYSFHHDICIDRFLFFMISQQEAVFTYPVYNAHRSITAIDDCFQCAFLKHEFSTRCSFHFL